MAYDSSSVVESTALDVLNRSIEEKNTSTPEAKDLFRAVQSTALDELNRSMENLLVMENQVSDSTIIQGSKRKKKNVCGSQKKRRKMAKQKAMMQTCDMEKATSEDGLSTSNPSTSKTSGGEGHNKAAKTGGLNPSKNSGKVPRALKHKDGEGPKNIPGPSPKAEQSGHRKAATAYADAAKKGLETVVRLKNGDISEEQSNLIQHCLFQGMLKKNTPLPNFERVSLIRGRMHFSCSNEASSKWLIEEIPSCIPWNDAELLACKASELPKMHLAKIWIPGREESETDVMKGLGGQNDLDTSKWKIQSYKRITSAEGKPKVDGNLLYVSVDDDSAKAISHRKTKLFFKFGSVNVKFIGSNKKN